MRPQPKIAPSKKSYIVRAGYALWSIFTLGSLLFVSNFPDPQNDRAVISLLGYALRDDLFLAFLVILPLIISTLLACLSQRWAYSGLAAASLVVATAGYWYSIVSIFGDVGTSFNTALEDITTVFQPAFFFMVPILVVVVAFTHMVAEFEKLEQHQYPGWLIPVRNFIFPVFSELHYLGLFWCTFMITVIHPELLLQELARDGRIIIFIVGVAYVSARMMTKHKFNHDSKVWIAATYYGFLSFICGMSLVSQLEALNGDGLLQQLNIILTGAYLGVAAIRFIASLSIARFGNVKFEKLMNERYSDDQYNIGSIVVLGLICLIAFGLVSTKYAAIETILLLTYAYSLIFYKAIFEKFAYFKGHSY